MSEPTPPGVPQDPAASTPPSAPPSAPSPPPSAPPPPGGGYAAGPPITGNVASAGYANNDEKNWSLMAHFGAVILGFIAPLVVFLVKGNESPTVRAHSVNALNFQLTWTIAGVISALLMCVGIGFVLLPLVVLFQIVMAVIAGIKANEGVLYTYPATFVFVK